MNTAERNKGLVSRFFDNLNAGDVDAVVSVYTDDATVETMGATLISGEYERAQIPQAISRIFTVFPKGLRFTVHDMVAEGEKVAVEAVCSGEHASGQSYDNQYHFLFEFCDGKLRKLREYMDTEQVTDVLCSGQRPPFGAD